VTILPKILLIDDDEELLDLISMVLMDAGHYVVTARDGEEGIKKFNELYFDVVVTDLMMPLCNGDEVARHVRKAGRNIPVIGITGTPWDIELGYFDIILKKPFALKILVENIKEVMNKG
jgi:DNA-binding response OmpR family regulator